MIVDLLSFSLEAISSTTTFFVSIALLPNGISVTQESTGGVTMSSAIETKKVVVEEIASKLKESKSTIIVDYRGLNVYAKQHRKQAFA